MQNSDQTLYVQMLGDFILTRQGHRLQLERNNITKAMHALQMLLYYYPEGVSRDYMLSCLYYSDNTADPINNLKVSISNLRRLLARVGLPESVSISYKGGEYRLNCGIPLEIDIHKMQRFAAEAENAPSDEEKKELYRKALACCTGEFLPHLSGSEWAAIVATRQRRLHHRCVMGLAAILTKEQQWEELYEIASAARTLFPCEDWHCLRIDSLIARELYEEAKAVYDEAVHELRSNFDVEPGSELVKRFRQLELSRRRNHSSVVEIAHALNEPGARRGAYYCSYPSFIDVYRFTSRALERTGQSVFMVLYWLVDSNGQLLSDTQRIAHAAEKLSESLSTSLRRGDAYTQHGRDRFLVLLIGTNRENCAIVSRRVEAKFHELGPRGVFFRSSLYMVGENVQDVNTDQSGKWT